MNNLTRMVVLMFLFAGLEGCAPLSGTRKQHTIRVSVAQLTSEPSVFHGKQVSVSGYAQIQFENDVLCPQRQPVTSRSCIWLNYDDGPYESEADMARYDAAEERWRSFDGKRIRVVGTFDARDTGHLGSTSGGLHHIIDVSVL